MSTYTEVTAHWTANRLTAGAGDQTSTPTVHGVGGAAIAVRKILNGATGPTVQGQLKVEGSVDGTVWFELGTTLLGTTANNALTTDYVEIPIPVTQIRFIGGSNTAQDVFVDGYVAEVLG